ncbi:zinc finger protein 501-like [Chrysoperla carnea]|uniref:zinc finger protein 501-like n=1 Tax=Chrysoperla carnea TaxID=189513 RepID=UPI001D062BFA|nr:zinc finger protein 501-like [Chrysoperla carnea]
MSFTSTINENNELPSQICNDCIFKTYQTINFKKQCERSEQYLLELLNEQTNDDKKWFKNTTTDKDNTIENISIKNEKENKLDIKDEPHQLKDNDDDDVISDNDNIFSDADDNNSSSENDDLDDDDDFKQEITTDADGKIIQTESNSASRTRKSRIEWLMTLGSDKCDINKLLCNICLKKLGTKSSLARHMETHDTNRKIYATCNVCNKGFHEKGNYVRHMIKHEKEPKHKCEHCSKKFYELSLLGKHLQKNHAVNPIECDECNKKFYLQEQYDFHMKIHKQDYEHICKYCNKGYFLLHRLQEHLLTHERTYLCTICNKTYKNHTSLNKHNFRYHKTVQEPQVCQICGKSVLQIKAHMLIHNGARMFECVECEKSFFYRSDLVAHCKRKHRKSDEPPPLLPYLCNICGKRKLSNAALKQHIIHAHTTEKTLKCTLCDKYFKTDNALKGHIRYIHKDVRNYKCTICTKSFYTNAILRNHMRTHTGERPFQCHICARAFGKNSTLKTHMKIHRAADLDN